MNADGTRAVTASADHGLRLYDLQEPEKELSPVNEPKESKVVFANNSFSVLSKYPNI